LASECGFDGVHQVEAVLAGGHLQHDQKESGFSSNQCDEHIIATGYLSDSLEFSAANCEENFR
jgi:hypothetical protein